MAMFISYTECFRCCPSAGGSETGEKSRFMPVSFDRVRLIQEKKKKHPRAAVDTHGCKDGVERTGSGVP